MDRGLLVRDVASIVVRDQPTVRCEQPDDRHRMSSARRWHSRAADAGMTALLKHLEGGIDDQAAIECAERQPEIERLDQHPHSEGRAAAGDRKADILLSSNRFTAWIAASVRRLSCVTRLPSTSEIDERNAAHESSSIPVKHGRRCDRRFGPLSHRCRRRAAARPR